MRRIVSGIMIITIVLSFLAFAFEIKPVRASPITIVVPDDYLTIQEAINSANVGDTIFVRSGTYYEHVIVNKTLSLIGENKETTIINGDCNGTVIIVRADNIIITGFTMRNSGGRPYGEGYYGGIVLIEVKDCVIFGNGVLNNSEGIWLYSSLNNIITSNSITNNYESIRLSCSNSNCIYRNDIANNWYGIYIINHSSNNNVTRNRIEANREDCIRITYYADNNSIIGNYIANSAGGIELYEASNNKIIGNSIVKNYDAILLDSSSSSNNIISRNNIADNMVAINLWRARTQTYVYHNNFLGNKDQVYNDQSAIIWDNGYPSGGNYWSNYHGTDLFSGLHQNVSGSDGIGDAPYVIDNNNIDRFPLVEPFPIAILGDINWDGAIDLFDLIVVAKSFGTRIGDLNWNEQADLYKDGIIDVFDFVIIGMNFGQTLTP